MTVVRGDGAIYNMSLAAATFAATPVKSDVQGLILPAVWPASPDSGRLYVGYSHSPNKRFYLDYGRSEVENPRVQDADEIRVFNTGTWHKVGTIKIKKSLWTAAIANDGRMLYVLSPQSHTVDVINTADMHEVRAIPVGGMPALALVSP